MTFIGILFGNDPRFLNLELGEEKKIGDFDIGVTAGQAWVDSPSLGETKQLEPKRQLALTDDITICAFEKRIDRVMWLRKQTGNPDLKDPTGGYDPASAAFFNAHMRIIHDESDPSHPKQQQKVL